MRPWFTLTIIAIITGCLLCFWWVIDFALQNHVMFETRFTITVRVPFVPSWPHRWTEVQFMYILTISVLLGAGIVAITTLIFDTRRTLKVRQMRKELTRLQKALADAQAHLPPPVVVEEAAGGEDPGAQDSLPPDDEKPITPEDITQSFEDIVEQGDFLNAAQRRVDDELEQHDGRRPEGDIRAIVTEPPEDALAASEEDVPADPAEQQDLGAHETPQDDAARSEADEDRIADDVVNHDDAVIHGDAVNHPDGQEISETDQRPKDDEVDEQSDTARQADEQNADEQHEIAVAEAEIVAEANESAAAGDETPQVKKSAPDSLPQDN